MPHFLSFVGGSVLVALSTITSINVCAETASFSKDFSESLTFNYSMATRADHENLSFRHQGFHAISKQSTPAILNAQSSSTAPLPPTNENQPSSSIVTIDEAVPSYIIHVPASNDNENLLQDERISRENASPSHEDEDLNESESSDYLVNVDGSTLSKPESSFSAIDHIPNYSRFAWPIVEQEHKPDFLAQIEEMNSELYSLATFSGLSTPDTSLARFVDVFSQDWEPIQEEGSLKYGTIPLVINDAVAKNLRYFQEGIPDRFQSYLDRFHHYKEVVEPIFREFGLPIELMYLSLVESGFNPRAFSRARASGPWQFMKATGRMYKLNVSWYVDERRDPIKSTVAAAHHLRDLYDRFGSWPLALAAYNAGSGKVSRAIRKTRTRDFWKIRRTWYLRRETKEYVPRFIAATLIATNPTAYGFLAPEGDRHEFEEVLISKPVQLAAITEKTGISLEELKRLNPELRRNIVPKSQGPGYHLKVPVGMSSLVTEHHEKFPVWTQPPPPPTQWYRVRRGDSLSVVARRFGMKVRQLKDMNNLSSNLIRVGKRLRVRGGDEDYADDQVVWYRVRYGDSLGKIADRFGTSVSKIKRLNNLSTHLIFPGDRLRVRAKATPTQTQTGDTKWYRVQRGDSLWSIAQQFSVSVRDLRSLNNLSSSIIRAGHMLLVSQ